MFYLDQVGKTFVKRKGNGEKVNFKALNHVNYLIERNKIYAIVGESGSGKSTLARIISGIETHDEGNIYYKETLIKDKKFYDKKDVRKAIQLVQQDSFSALNPRISIKKCLLEPIRNLCNISDQEALEKIKMLLSMVELDEEVMHKRATQLSGGQLKRVNIARAIASDPELIIFDEATSGLDVVVKKKILDLLKSIQEKTKCSLLFITHDIEVAMYMSHHIAVMEKGTIVENVLYDNDLNCFEHRYSKLLIESTYLEEACTHRVG